MVAPTTRWSTLRSQLSGWRSGNQNFSKDLVAPVDQDRRLLNHPLLMEGLHSSVGMMVLGLDPELYPNRLPISNDVPAVVPNPVPFVPVMLTWVEQA
jgi:hypothetical protein